MYLLIEIIHIAQVNRLIGQNSVNSAIKVAVQSYSLHQRFSDDETQNLGNLRVDFFVCFIHHYLVRCFVSLAQPEHACIRGKGLNNAHIDPLSEQASCVYCMFVICENDFGLQVEINILEILIARQQYVGGVHSKFIEAFSIFIFFLV